MKAVGRTIVVGAMVCAVISAMTLINCSSSGKAGATEQQAGH